MSNQAPNPTVVAERYAAVTGIGRPNPDRGPLTLVGADYGITTAALDIAVVQARFAEEPETIFTMPCGHFDPATGRWLLAEEYVEKSEQPALRRLLDRGLTPEIAHMLRRDPLERGETIIEAHHPLTGAVRAELAGVIGSLVPLAWLGRADAAGQLQADPRDPGDLLAADDFTIAYPELQPTVFGYGGKLFMVPDTDVTVCYSGVKIARAADPRFTVRGTRSLTLASRTSQDLDAWVLNPAVVTVEEWEVVRDVVPILQRARQNNRHFDPAFAAVVTNSPYRTVT